MLKGENIICISSIDWDFVWQGHQEIMDSFARNGNRVLFIENTGVRVPNFKDIPRLRKRILAWLKSTKGFREEMANLYVYSPLIFPFPYSRFMRWINKFLFIRPIKRWMKITEFYNPIIWTFLPTGIALDIIDNIDRKLLVYYCIADFYKLADNPNKVKKTENELIRKSDMIFVQGETLAKKCRQFNNNVYIFPFGVKIEAFDNFQHISRQEIPREIRGIKKPIVGYIGGIHRHIDFRLLRFVAESHPEWSIVLIGPIQTDVSEIMGLKNIFLLGKKDFSSLPAYISEFDAGIIPYEINEYTITVFPTKLNEYHAMGKNVVSTELPEIIKFNSENNDLVLIGRTYQEFINCISQAVKPKSKTSANERILSARKNDWALRVEAMSSLLEEGISNKAKYNLKWQEALLKLYKTIRKKTFNTVAVILTSYLLAFYTPLVWQIAKPLKIIDIPKQADCIVVFAGGVGESGKPGQGYEERVQYAVELYKKNYAPYLIFSSGYAYALKEAEVMKALAVSMGVPGDKILLEEKAANTYENVKFTKEILHKNNSESVLLVTSPYNTRRASLVFNKVAKNIRVFHAPALNSLFYSHPHKYFRQTNIRQIKGILHEYLGIIYYWWRGYV